MCSQADTSESDEATPTHPLDEESPLLHSPDDTTSVCKPPSRKAKRSDIFLICGTFIGVLIASADESLVISIYSAVASQFQHLSEGSWLLVAYNFGYCVSLPLYGALSDFYGRKNVLLGSYILFMLANLLCGASTSLTQLVLARGIAGFSGAGMIAVVSFIITDIMPPSDFALYRGYENVVNVVGRSLGAPIGGFLTDTIGWRWSFFGQIPCMVVCTLVVIYGFPTAPRSAERAETASTAEIEEPSDRSFFRDFDLAGITTFCLSIFSFLYLIQQLGADNQARPALVPMLAGFFLLSSGGFIAVELRWARKPLIPIWLLAQGFGVHCLIQVLLMGSRFLFLSNLIPYFVRVDGASNLEASIAYIPASLGVSVGGVVSGLVIKRVKRVKIIIILGLTLIVFAFGLIFFQWRDGSSPWGKLSLLLLGFGAGLTFPAFFVAISSCIPKKSLSTGISIYYLSQQLGLVLGPACGAALCQALFERNLRSGLNNIPDLDETIRHILDDVRFSRGLSQSLQVVVRSAYLASFQSLPLCAGIVTGLAIPLAILLKDASVD